MSTTLFLGTDPILMKKILYRIPAQEGWLVKRDMRLFIYLKREIRP